MCENKAPNFFASAGMLSKGWKGEEPMIMSAPLPRKSFGVQSGIA